MAWKKSFELSLITLCSILCLVVTSYAEETITGFTEQDLPILNEELRQIRRSIYNNRLGSPLATSLGGTGATAVANAANGVVVLNASSQLPAVSGALLTGVIPSGLIAMWSGTIATIPTGWYLCNGSNGTPDLRDRFIVGATQDDTVAKTNVTGVLTQSGDGTIPAHTHTISIASGGSVPGTTRPYGVTDAQGATPTTSSSGTGTKNIAVYYALAFIMKQ